MTVEQAMKIKSFASNWITKVVAKRKDYGQRLLDVLEELFPNNMAEYDPYDMLSCKDWDWGESYQENGRTRYWAGMGDRLTELIEWDDYNTWNLSKTGKNEFICSIRIAIDLLVEQSGGVVGYTVGDLRKVFDGNIPEEIASTFEPSIKEAKDFEPVWL